MKREVKTFAPVLLLIMASFTAANAQEKKPEAELKRISINRIDWLKQTADATATVEIASTGIALKVKDVSYKLKLNGEQVAEGKRDDEINLTAASKTTVDFPVTINLRALPFATWNVISDGLKLRYDVEAEFSVSVFMLSNRMKTSFRGDVPITKALSSLSEKIK